MTKVHHILKSWNIHYGEVYEQLSKAREILTELYSQQKTTTDILLQQQIKQQISMQSKCINQLQEEENQWFQHSWPARDEVHWLTERARRLITQADQYTTTIDTSLNTVQDEPLELKTPISNINQSCCNIHCHRFGILTRFQSTIDGKRACNVESSCIRRTICRPLCLTKHINNFVNTILSNFGNH